MHAVYKDVACATQEYADRTSTLVVGVLVSKRDGLELTAQCKRMDLRALKRENLLGVVLFLANIASLKMHVDSINASS
jgi:hypothetical protein